MSAAEDVRDTLRRFQEGYAARDKGAIDAFMELFDDGDIEMLGISAAERGGFEWFSGVEAIREIVLSDWTYWGAVTLDVEGAKITVNGDTAWLSTTGTMAQMGDAEDAMPFYIEQMAGFLKNEKLSPDARMMEATHYGMRRLRERSLGAGHAWPFVLTAVLIKKNGVWRFHTLHWSMPLD
jgi:hypothetical protein